METIKHRKNIHFSFNSLGEYMEHVLAEQTLTSAEKAEGFTKSKMEGAERDEWAGGSFKQALQLQSEGWGKRPDLSKLSKAVQSASSAELSEQSTMHAVSGAYVDVPVFLTGEPECMVEFIDEPQPKAVRLAMNLSTNWRMSEKAFQLRGAVVLALAEKLEAAGYPVEIICYTAVKSSSVSRGKPKISMAFPLKQADEVTDVDALTYWACHPSALRRLQFSAWENAFPPAERAALGFAMGGGYGSVTTLEESYLAKKQIAPDVNVDFESGRLGDAVNYFEEEIERLERKLAI